MSSGVGFVDEPQPHRRRRGRGLQLVALGLACVAAWQVGVLAGEVLIRAFIPG